MICRRCRDYFQVWGSKLDERLGLPDKNPDINPNWARGGDRRSSHAKPLALNTKKQAEQLVSSGNSSLATPNSERSFIIGDEIGDDDVINIDRYDPEPNEAPEDARIGLEDPEDEQQRYQDDGNDEEDNSGDDRSNSEDQDHSVEEPSSILINNNIDASFLRGKILVLKVIDGDTEVPICALCKQPSFEGEIITNVLENRLRNSFHKL